MSIIEQSFIRRGRALLGGAVVASLLTLGAGSVSAGASTRVLATESAFCHTILTFHSHAPTGTTYSSYQKWAKTYLPFWEKLASEAPSSGSKRVLTELVTILKHEATVANYKTLGTYIASHQTQWIAGWKAFTKDITNCALSAY
ncbi:MAG TPA: hypothetical protein VND83_08330 [Acidimicrobiales bacterium]|nr:hypothetical protein [Acidimicrobiales bacterium]